jgi:hypothetical protein
MLIVTNQYADSDTPISTMLLHVPLVDQADYVCPLRLKDSNQCALEYERKIGMLSVEALPRIVEASIMRIDPEWNRDHRPLWWPLILGFPIHTTEGSSLLLISVRGLILPDTRYLLRYILCDLHAFGVRAQHIQPVTSLPWPKEDSQLLQEIITTRAYEEANLMWVPMPKFQLLIWKSAIVCCSPLIKAS